MMDRVVGWIFLYALQSVATFLPLAVLYAGLRYYFAGKLPRDGPPGPVAQAVREAFHPSGRFGNEP